MKGDGMCAKEKESLSGNRGSPSEIHSLLNPVLKN
jgi:hypothetical protein